VIGASACRYTAGLCLALSNWSVELQIIQRQETDLA
jgi:hypothetical protein